VCKRYHKTHLDRTLLKAAGIEAAAATAKRNTQNSLVPLFGSVCHKDLLPTTRMTALFRNSHPRGAEDRQGQHPEHAVPQVKPAAPHTNANVSSQEANELKENVVL